MTPLDDFALQQSSSFMVRGFLQALTTTIEEKVEDQGELKVVWSPGKTSSNRVMNQRSTASSQEPTDARSDKVLGKDINRDLVQGLGITSRRRNSFHSPQVVWWKTAGVQEDGRCAVRFVFSSDSGRFQTETTWHSLGDPFSHISFVRMC